jgi:CRISPR-associated endonuclease/helicase Cas3
MAHCPSKENARWQALKDYAEGVSARLEHHLRYLTLLENVPELLSYAKLTGYLHDLGKYRDDFRKHRLGWNSKIGQREAFVSKKVPHSDAGTRFTQSG